MMDAPPPPADYTRLAEWLVSAGVDLAGLILVFLGITVAAFEAYDATQRGAVRSRYQRRAIKAFSGLSLAVLAVVFAFLSEWSCRQTTVIIALVCFGLAIVVTMLAAVAVIRDFFR
jgi:L-asparagine transporter-like permease